MKKASEFLSDQQKQAIEAAVAKAESNTAGEIVPVLATVSGRYDRAEDIVGLLVGVIALAVAWLTTPMLQPEPDWGGPSVTALVLAIGCVVVGFVVGSTLATWFPVLRLPFIPKGEMQDEVQRAAQAVFMQERIRQTKDATGILIFVSLYEHQVVILPDDGIAADASNEVWNEVCKLLIEGLKKGDPVKGFEDAIDKCGQVLAEHCPRQADDVDEHHNALRMID